MRAEAGAPFSLWGGEIHGTTVFVETERRLEQEWHGGDWPQPSFAAFALAPDGDGTRLTLIHTGVPDDEAAGFDAGWGDYYLGPLKAPPEGGEAIS